MLHKHHKIPRYVGGTDDPDNIIELTIEEHAEAHKKLWVEYDQWQDYVAWKALSGQITHEEATVIAIKQAAMKRLGVKRGKYKRHKTPKPRSTPMWNKGLKCPEAAKHIKNQIYVCPHCKKVGNGPSMYRWHFDNCHILVGKTKICPYCKKEGSGLAMDRYHFHNCRHNPNRSLEYEKKQLVCPHCKKTGCGQTMHRWHFDNCKHKVLEPA